MCSNTSDNRYRFASVNLNPYQGQSVTLRFRSTTDGSLISAFFIDNVSFSTNMLLNDEEGASQEPIVVEPKPAYVVETLEPKQFTPDPSILTEAPAIFEEAPVEGSADE